MWTPNFKRRSPLSPSPAKGPSPPAAIRCNTAFFADWNSRVQCEVANSCLPPVFQPKIHALHPVVGAVEREAGTGIADQRAGVLREVDHPVDLIAGQRD